MAARFLAFAGDPQATAEALLGQRLVRVLDGTRLAGTIVEVEAYLGPRDRACHTWNGRRTPRIETMYHGGGYAYVYFTYGMHHCLNVVCGRPGDGAAVLLRAIQPTEGLEVMRVLRPAARRDLDLCRGPGRLTAALGLDLRHDRLDLRASGELFIERLRRGGLAPGRAARTRRVGVESSGVRWAGRRLRYLLRGNPYVSRTFP
jgi:DNA-3-methyladenine glycosylase